jgi:hypothetical protein
MIGFSLATAVSSLYAVGESHRPAALHSTTLPIVSCGPSDVFANLLVNWLKHTVGDTGYYAALNRASATLPQTSPDSVSLVTTDSLCAVLKAKFARVAAARDTLTPHYVYVVFVAPSKYVVTDVKMEGTPYQETAHSIILPDERMEIATMTVALDSVRVWKYNPVPRMPTPY